MGRRFLPLFVLAVGSAASIALFFFTRANIEREARQRFERQADEMRHVIQLRVKSYIDALQGLAALFSKPGPVSGLEFHRYVVALDLPRRYPGFQALSYAEYVTHAQKRAFEARMRRDASVDLERYRRFAIWPPGDRPDYFVVTLVAPAEPRSLFAVGLDMTANPTARNLQAISEALHHGRDTGEITSSGQLLTTVSGGPALAMRLPVYRQGASLGSVEERRRAYAGSVGAAYFVIQIMQGALDNATLRYLRFKLYDGGPLRRYTGVGADPKQDQLLFDSRDLVQPASAEGEPAFRIALPTEAAGRVWEIHFSAPQGAFVKGADRALPALALGGGLIATALLALIFYSIAASARRVEVAHRRAEAANVAKTKFLAAASHDLRQPMQALSMYASVLEQRADDPRTLRVVRGIELSVRTLEQLFDGLLDISKIESGVIEPQVLAFPLMPVIERVVEAERPIAAQKSLDLHAVRTTAWVRSDPALLERMLKNLVTNAIRYTELGRVFVGCRRAGAMGLRLQVVDSGIGIPVYEQERIFDEYYQLGGKSVQGLGLGLPIVKSLGALLGHAVTVRSVQGRGTIFSIELSRAAPAPAVESVFQPAAAPSGLNVALVDDDAEIRASMRLLLEGWGCRCISGGTVAEIERELRAQQVQPDSLIVDYRLADGSDGVEAIGRLRAEFGADLPALIITGTANLSLLRQRSRDIPVAMKPVPPGKLRAFLSQVSRSRASAGEQSAL